MKILLEFRIALKYLASSKGGFVSVVSAFSFIGIMLGVATLIVVMAVMNGFKDELLDRILGVNSHLTIYSVRGNIASYDEYATEIENLAYIKKASPVFDGQVMVASQNYNSGAMVKGAKKQDLLQKPLLADNILAGSLAGDFTGFKIIIGSKMADNLAVTIGDKVTLISPKTNNTIFGAIPTLKDFTIAGIFSVGMAEYDAAFIYMPLDTAQLYFNKAQIATSIEVDFTDDIEIASANKVAFYKRQLVENLPSSFFITDWQEANSGFFEAIEVQRNVMFLILALIILVAAFNIISGMVMLVNSKTKEIAILKTMGFSSYSIMKIFIIAGFLIGLIGSLLGLALGLSFALNIETIRQFLEGLTGTNLFSDEVYFLSKLPARIIMKDVLSVTILALGLSFLATIFPARKAAKTSPVAILRYS